MRWTKCFLLTNFAFWTVLLLVGWQTPNGNKLKRIASAGMNTRPKTRGDKYPQRELPLGIARLVVAKVKVIAFSVAFQPLRLLRHQQLAAAT
jgi:hypothetical protein